MKLPARVKLLWFYILTNCDKCGIWKANYRLASLHCKGTINKKILTMLDEQLYEFKKNTFYVKGYIELRYGNLSESCKPHQPIIRKLRVEGLLKEGNININFEDVKDEQFELLPETPKPKQRRQKREKKIPDTMQIVSGKYFENEEVDMAFKKFLSERIIWKKPATEYAIELLIKTLNRLSAGDPQKALLIIERSVKSRWLDFFPLNKQIELKQKNTDRLKSFINAES
jgi:hypothetical protein